MDQILKEFDDDFAAGRTPATTRQLHLIAEMQNWIDDAFTGETHLDACIWIDEHLDDYRLLKSMKEK